jgi:N-acetylmuramoyl-L-alanine amidase
MSEYTFLPDHASASVRVSPNFGERCCDTPVEFLILHYTGMETGQGAEDWLCSLESEVSCHYIVHEDGRIVQMVAEEMRAWHAGKAHWAGMEDINSRSIGIEIVNGGHDFGLPAYPGAQIDAVIALADDIVMRNGIRPPRVLAHSDIAPQRKRDPGERFPWAQLCEAGLGHWVEPSPIRGGRYLMAGETGQPVEALQSMLALYGYGLAITGVFDPATETVVSAFQRHFRPERVDGIADISTIETLHRLISASPEYA